MFPCSVMAIAGIFSSTALSSSSSIRHAPSSSEYSECRCRWTKSLIADWRLQTADSRTADCRMSMGATATGARAPIVDRHSAVCNLQCLLPLDCRGRLRTNIVDDAVDAADFVDDARGDRFEQLV